MIFLYSNPHRFDAPYAEKYGSHAAKLTIAGQAFVFASGPAKHCSIIMHCNMHFR
jgi:hypothetical protein